MCNARCQCLANPDSTAWASAEVSAAVFPGNLFLLEVRNTLSAFYGRAAAPPPMHQYVPTPARPPSRTTAPTRSHSKPTRHNNLPSSENANPNTNTNTNSTTSTPTPNQQTRPARSTLRTNHHLQPPLSQTSNHNHQQHLTTHVNTPKRSKHSSKQPVKQQTPTTVLSLVHLHCATTPSLHHCMTIETEANQANQPTDRPTNPISHHPTTNQPPSNDQLTDRPTDRPTDQTHDAHEHRFVRSDAQILNKSGKQTDDRRPPTTT